MTLRATHNRVNTFRSIPEPATAHAVGALAFAAGALAVALALGIAGSLSGGQEGPPEATPTTVGYVGSSTTLAAAPAAPQRPIETFTDPMPPEVRPHPGGIPADVTPVLAPADAGREPLQAWEDVAGREQLSSSTTIQEDGNSCDSDST